MKKKHLLLILFVIFFIVPIEEASIAYSYNSLYRPPTRPTPQPSPPPPSHRMPDLVVTKVLYSVMNGSIGYILENIGNDTAKGGHTTVLYVGGREVDKDVVEEDIHPGGRYTSWFKNYVWTDCRIHVKVCADNDDVIKELNESNNCLEADCSYIGIPLRIISGPDVNVTQSHVIVTWVTNKPSDTYLEYWISGSKSKERIRNSSLVWEHRVIIDVRELIPLETYRFFVGSRDTCGDIETSSNVFRIVPEDVKPPSVTLRIPDRLSGEVLINATASDDVRVDYVNFYVDGVLKFTDFDPPYQWRCNTMALSNGRHEFKAEAVDPAGNNGSDVKVGIIDNVDVTPPMIRILSPSGGDILSDRVNVTVTAWEVISSRGLRGYIDRIEIYIDERIVFSWEQLPTDQPTRRKTVYYLWDTSRLSVGSLHNITAIAWDDSGLSSNATIQVRKMSWYIPERQPRVDVTTSVTRHRNYFMATVTIVNTGETALSNIEAEAYFIRFQPTMPLSVSKPEYADASYEIRYDWRSGVCRVIAHISSLRQRDSFTYRYFLVPFLTYARRAWTRPQIPSSITRLIFGPEYYMEVASNLTGYYQTSEGEECYNLPLNRVYVPSEEELRNALGSSDYLIITNIGRLYAYNSDDHESVNLLLQRMAELAVRKNGILGYLNFSSSNRFTEVTEYDLKRLISPHGEWASKLSAAFNDPNPEENRDAYLLIVGETEIVPSHTYIRNATKNLTIDYSDHFYADVIGDERPDLIVGRIIGNTARDLIKPIEASLNFIGFSTRKYAICLSGYEEPKGIRTFVDYIENVSRTLREKGIESHLIHWSNFSIAWGYINFTDFDAFTLGDVDGDGVDEIITASDDDGHVRIYKVEGDHYNVNLTLLHDLDASFTKYDDLKAGDVDGDDMDEIVIARNDPDFSVGSLLIYDPHGNLIAYRNIRFSEGDVIEVRNLGFIRNYIFVAREGNSSIQIFHLRGDEIEEAGVINLPFEFDDDYGFAAGKISSRTNFDIVIIKNDTIYLVNVNDFLQVVNTNQININLTFSRFYGLDLADTDSNGLDEIIIVKGEEKMIYRYYMDEGELKHEVIYSRYLPDWFRRMRCTGDPTGQDCLAIGRVLSSDETPHIVVVKPSARGGRFYVLAASCWSEVSRWVSKQLGWMAEDAQVIIVHGHGNPDAASPLTNRYERYWGDFTYHPLVGFFACLTGDYEYNDDYGLVEAMLKHGAAVCIAATEEHWASSGRRVCNEFLKAWSIYSGCPPGKAFTIAERNIKATYDVRPVMKYNYYGDPKFSVG